MMQKNYLKNRRLALAQERFIYGLEGIGDILVFETRKKRNKNVLQGLKRIEKIIKDFLSIRRNDPEKFDKLLLSQEFFDIYSKDKKEASLRLGFDPERYLISLSTAINQILRIHKTAIEERNDEISSFATYHINYILADISKEVDNERFVEYLLQVLARATKAAIVHQDRSMHPADVRWYTDIVFNRLRQKDGEFQISYLPLFDSYFFSEIRYIISENQTSLFESMVSSLVDGILIEEYNGDVWEYGHILLSSDFPQYELLNKQHGIDERIKELDKSIIDLNTKDKLDKWLKRFNELKSILEPYLKTEGLEKSKKIEEEIRSLVVGQFKFNNLLEIAYSTGAYCLFKQKLQYIKYLWEYRQPPDSDASWIGHDIVPTSINSVLNYFFWKSSFERRLDFWEGHHGSELYYKEYFLLLLARILRNYKKNEKGKYEQLESYNLPILHIHSLSALEYSVDDLINIAGNIKNKTELLGTLGFDLNNTGELFNDKLIPFLKNLKLKAQEAIKNLEKIQHINSEKVIEFKESFLSSFNKETVLRDILKYYNLFEYRAEEKNEDKKVKFGINEVSEKAPFFKEWHVHYSDWGSNYGRSSALSENREIFKKIIDNCTEITIDELGKTLDKFKDLSCAAILVTHPGFYKFIERLENFKGKWRKDSPQLTINGFEGSYIHKGVDVPVFNTYSKIKDEEIVIINKEKLGKLIQYSPLSAGENKELQNDIFYMDIQELAPDTVLSEKLLNKPPEWLVKIGDKEKQKGYLQGRVLINIFEKFEFCQHPEFEGYLIKIPKEK